MGKPREKAGVTQQGVSDKHTKDEDIDEQDKQSEDTATGGAALRHAATLDADVAREDERCQTGLDEEGGEGGCAGCHHVEGVDVLGLDLVVKAADT